MRISKPAAVVCYQYCFFIILFCIGWVFMALYIIYYDVTYVSYSFTRARLAELQLLMTDGCYNLTDLPCSLQMYINTYFLSNKCLLVYHSSIVIGMIYTMHHSVRLSHCIYAMSGVTFIIFSTNLVLYSDRIVLISTMVCGALVVMSGPLENLMPYDADDPLRVLCERMTLPNRFNGCLLTGHSKRARFYRWAKRMKTKWNIKDEKLTINLIIGTIIVIVAIAMVVILDRICP
jgi:hypothetical protein